MSRLRLNKIATPVTPAASKGELFYSSTVTPNSFSWIDESGNLYRIGGIWRNGATAGFATAFASDTYLPGTSINVGTTGIWQVGMVYRALFDVVKTAAGTATAIVTLRMGTAASTADTAICTFTFTAQTGVADTGVFVVEAEFRSVGSGTAAVVAGVSYLNHQLASTGLSSAGTAGYEAKPVASSGFNSTTSNVIGCSFNGGASFSGTNVMSSATLMV